MARPIWKGNISFGLVNIPVVLFSAEKKSELHFKLLDNRDKGEIRYERVNEATGQEVPWDQIVKGYEYDPGEFVVLDEEDFKNAAVEATQTVEIEDFVDLASIPYVYFEKPYYVVPGKKAEKGYVLLREVLKRTGKVAVARVVIRTRQYLAALVPQQNGLVLNIMRYYHELRDPSEFEFPAGALDQFKITDRELQMAEMLVESMTGDWDPEKYLDNYREALLKFIRMKVEAGDKTVPAQGTAPAKEEPGKVIDMMALLKKSIEQASRGRGKEAAPARRASRGDGERRREQPEERGAA